MRQSSESTDASGETVVTSISDDSEQVRATGAVSARGSYNQRAIEHRDLVRNCECHCQSKATRGQSVRTTGGKPCLTKRVTIYTVLITFISVNLSVMINIAINKGSVLTPITPSQSENLELKTNNLEIQIEELKKERLCFECVLLRAYIDEWAWKSDVTENVLLDECCFDDYLTLLRTFKFYTDVKVSQLQSDISKTSHDMRQIHNAIQNISEAARKAPNGTVTPQIIYHIPEDIQKMVGSIASKKRSILYVKSDGLVTSEAYKYMSLISWSSSNLFFPIVQGNLKLYDTKSGIMNRETGYYSIRVEIKFKAQIQPNQTQTTDLRYYLKYRPERGQPITIQTFSKKFTFSEDWPEYEGVVYKVTQLRKGDRVEVHVPRDGSFVSLDKGTHSICIIEES